LQSHLRMLAVKDLIVRNPHASILLLFAGAFTVFALSGDDDDGIQKSKKRPSFLRRLFCFLANADDLSSSVKRQKVPPTRDQSSGIVVLLEVCVTIPHLATISDKTFGLGKHLGAHFPIVLVLSRSQCIKRRSWACIRTCSAGKSCGTTAK